MTVKDQTELLHKLARFSNLPSIPQIVVQIKEIADDPKASPADLANVILSDHQLTSRILRMANSAYYSEYSGRIMTVTHAIVVMGYRAVHNIAVSMAIYGVMNDFSKRCKFDLVAFWTRSLACGVIAKFLARSTGRTKHIETAFIAGFMHDIGQVILAGTFPDKYEQLAKIDPGSPDLCEAERVLLGVDHQQVGAHVAHSWNLPETLVRPIGEHHTPPTARTDRPDDLLVDLVHLGDWLYPYAMSGTQPEDRAFAEIVKRVREVVDITEEQVTRLLVECREQVSEVARDLEIDIQGELEKRSNDDLNALNQQLHSKEVQLAFLQNAISALMEANSEDEILQIICEAMFRGLQMGRVVLFAYDPKWDCFSGRVGFGVASQREVHSLNFSAKEGLFRTLREGSRPVAVVDAASEIYGAMVTDDELARLEAESFAALPLKVLGEIRYVVFADARNRRKAIDDEALHSMMSLVNQGAMSLERHLFQKQLSEHNGRSES